MDEGIKTSLPAGQATGPLTVVSDLDAHRFGLRIVLQHFSYVTEYLASSRIKATPSPGFSQHRTANCGGRDSRLYSCTALLARRPRRR